MGARRQKSPGSATLLPMWRTPRYGVVGADCMRDRATGCEAGVVELLEAGMAELNEAISHFARWQGTSPPGTQWKTLSFLVFATKRIRDAMSQLTMDRGA